MAKKRTELVFVIDKSGSMSGSENDTTGGFNSMLNKIKAEDIPCRLTTVMFNDRYEIVHDRLDIDAVMPMTINDYLPGGSTALVDAAVMAIEKTIKVQKNSDEKHRAEEVIFVIITDGEENASRKFTASHLKRLIKKEQDDYGWEFIFLGANIDAVTTADSYGIRRDRAFDFLADGEGVGLNYTTIAGVAAAVSTEEGDVRELKMQEALGRIKSDYRKRGI